MFATARRYATEPGGPYYEYYRSLGTKLIRNGRANLFTSDPSGGDDTVTVEKIAEDLVIWGTPDKVADDLLTFRESVGDFGTLLFMRATIGLTEDGHQLQGADGRNCDSVYCAPHLSNPGVESCVTFSFPPRTAV